MMTCRSCNFAVIFAGFAMVTACNDAPPETSDQDSIGTDPVMARALNDPLMIDPDLAWINEANAAIGFTDNHALPAFPADEQAAARARDASRIELREDGNIEELPTAKSLADGKSLSGLWTLREIMEATDAPQECWTNASDDLAWAAKLDKVASIIPHGMVQQAAGMDGNDCALRIVRYTTQVDAQDALQYHFTRASRAKLETAYLSGQSNLIKGEKAGEKVFADVADAPGGLRIVTLVHWKN